MTSVELVAEPVSTAAPAAPQQAFRLLLTGQVQGIGLRPAISRLAMSLGLSGSVRNVPSGVEVEIEGDPARLHAFLARSPAVIPEGGRLADCQSTPLPTLGRTGWHIEPAPHTGLRTTPPPRDRGVCGDCLAEVADDTNDRRGSYPFTSCTHCGPRYSVLRALPFERSETAWAPFTMCPSCQREFESVVDRRFHAELNGCARCGPRVRLVDEGGRLIERPWRDAIAAALRAGQVVALLGIGGYQLLCDATQHDAVARLRRFKARPIKPLAVLVADLAAARRIAELSAVEAAALSDAANPIVLARARASSPVAACEVHPGLSEVGVLLPTTPLHWLIARDFDRPLICTSANREGEPLLYRTLDLDRPRPDLADLWLEHDREVVRPIDDSVVRAIAGRVVTIRLGRGLAPLPLDLPRELLAQPPALAVGGHEKSAFAWHNGYQAALGPHVGDLDAGATLARFDEQIAACQQLYDFAPRAIFSDAHPDYGSTRWAQSRWPQSRATRLHAEQAVRVHSVQHHHAHVASAIVDHGVWNQQVLGVAWDGSGLGADGELWGGEFLLASLTHSQRVARLRPIPLLGGAAAIRQPARVAVALLREALGELPDANVLAGVDVATARAWVSVLDRPQLAPRASSIGRLFDGVAALAFDLGDAQAEARPAMLLEAIADRTDEGVYPFPLAPSASGRLLELDWRPLVAAVWRDLARGAATGVVSMRFHRALARGVSTIARRFPQLPVALTGGVFQNRLLTELIVEQFAADGTNHRLLLPGVIPPNDGGLAAGQLAIGLARLAAGRESSEGS